MGFVTLLQTLATLPTPEHVEFDPPLRCGRLPYYLYCLRTRVLQLTKYKEL